MYKENSNLKRLKESISIEKQKTSERTYISGLLELKKSLKYEKLQTIIYKPSIIALDTNKNIYIFDSPVMQIHKISLTKDFDKYKQIVFKTMKGQGPGEIGRLSDFKIYKNKLYLIDKISNSIKIYSNNGSLIKDIRIKSNLSLILEKITFSDEKPIICTYANDFLFHKCNIDGNVLKNFGNYIDKTNNEIIYHQYSVSNSVNKNEFYYFPLYLGFVGVYKDCKLLFAKETIDGVKSPRVINEKIGDSRTSRMSGMSLMTVYDFAIHEEFIIIKVVDMVKKKSYWDIYTPDTFNYLFSLKNPPKVYDFVVKENILVCAEEEVLNIYNIKNLIEKIRAKHL